MKNPHQTYLEAMARVPINTNMFGYVGYIGSLTNSKAQPRDVDILVLPTAEAESQGYGRICIELSDYLDEVDRFLQKDHKIITARAPRVCDQDRTAYLIQNTCGKKPLEIHTLLFLDKQSLARIAPERFVKSVSESNVPIYGDFQNAMNELRECEDKRKMDALKFLNEFNVLQTAGKFPKELTRTETEHLAKYFKKWYNVDINAPRNPEDCKKLVKEMALAIDERVA